MHVLALFALIALLSTPALALTPLESLGRRVFFDANLSLHRNQSCASCHAPGAGFTSPDARVNAGGSVVEGSVAGRFGNRKPPSAAYAAFAPKMHVKTQDGESVIVGGLFWDGRADGRRLGSPAAEQAQGPFLNPAEQALPDAACVVQRVCTADYGKDFSKLHPGACAIAWPTDMDEACSAPREPALAPAERRKVARAYDQLARAIAAYEASSEVSPFSSKFDAVQARRASFTPEEKLGREVFADKGKCANCHVLDKRPKGRPALFTDHTFDNLGVPRNPANPWYAQAANKAGEAWKDEGLGGFLATRPEWKKRAAEGVGKQRVPTLRNVDRVPEPGFTKAFMHNGWFKTLEGVVSFYNTRDTRPRCTAPMASDVDAMKAGCWPEPEIAANVNTRELGDLKLTAAEERALVAFMKTLTDGYRP